MMLHRCKCCVSMMLAGFFAFPAVAQIVRLAIRVPVVIGDYSVPMSVSALIALVTGLLSFAFCKAGVNGCRCAAHP